MICLYWWLCINGVKEHGFCKSNVQAVIVAWIGMKSCVKTSLKTQCSVMAIRKEVGERAKFVCVCARAIFLATMLILDVLKQHSSQIFGHKITSHWIQKVAYLGYVITGSYLLSKLSIFSLLVIICKTTEGPWLNCIIFEIQIFHSPWSTLIITVELAVTKNEVNCENSQARNYSHFVQIEINQHMHTDLVWCSD